MGIRGASRSYYLFDGLGSVVALTNASGSVTNSYTYDPFGTTTETKAFLTNVFNPWRYTSQYQDTTTGLYKIGARYYQPELGRWTQPDPSGQDANAYLYAGGNPATFTDVTGLSAFSEFKDYLTAADADKAFDDPEYNNRSSNVEAVAAESVRDAGEFLADNGPTALAYAVSCIMNGAEVSKVGSAVPNIGPVAGAVAGCALGLGATYVGNKVIFDEQ